MHGGATGSGAQAGNRNALKHGRYTRELLEFRHSVRELLRESAAEARADIGAGDFRTMRGAIIGMLIGQADTVAE